MCLCMLPLSAGQGEGATVEDERREVGAAENAPGGENAEGTREGTGRPKEKGKCYIQCTYC